MLANAVCVTLITHLFNCVIYKPVIKGILVGADLINMMFLKHFGALL